MLPHTAEQADLGAQHAAELAAAHARRDSPACCPYYHQAVELIGRRWTGAILEILLQSGPLRFSTIAAAVPDLSDRMLSDRLKELESHRLVERTVYPGPPVRVQYALTHRGQQLAPALYELKRWAQTWLTGTL
jgi:DNA-binding HxlR family transcriptional regulator